MTQLLCRECHLRGVTSSQISSIEIKEWAEFETEETPKHAGDTGYLQAVQSAGGEALYVGFPVTYESDNPAVVEVSQGVFTDMGEYEFKSEGAAVVTATLLDNPAVTGSITFNVEPAGGDGNGEEE